MLTRPIEGILVPKPEARSRIYAYSIADEAHASLLKIGQIIRDVKQCFADQLKTSAIKKYTSSSTNTPRHHLHRRRGARGACQEEIREHRAGVDALLGQGC